MNPISRTYRHLGILVRFPQLNLQFKEANIDYIVNLTSFITSSIKQSVLYPLTFCKQILSLFWPFKQNSSFFQNF